MFDLNSLDPAKVTHPIVTGPGIKFVRPEIIRLDEIYVQPQENNPVRIKTKDPYQIQKLQVNLSNGINYGRMPPVVCESNRQINGRHYRYELLCGHHRLEALEILKYDRWIFWVYKHSLEGYSFEDSVRTLQIMENDHDSALASEAHDVSNIIIRLIERGSRLVTNEESSIKSYVDTYCKNMHYNTRAKVVRQVMAKCNTYQQVVTYTANDAFRWIHDNTDYTYAGNFDTQRKKYGWTVLEGYEYEYMVSAMKKFAETKNESYFICHTKPPTKDYALEDKRERMLDSFKHFEYCLKEVFEYYQEHKKFPWKAEVFMPQDQSKEPKDRPVLIK